MLRIFTSLLFCWCGLTFAVTPGLDSRAVIGAYLDGALPMNAFGAGAGPMPPMLSLTGAFTSTVTRTPHPGLVPYELNSPLWTDGAVKSRFIALPFDGTAGSAGSPPIGFSPTGSWTFPNGTVIVKNFDMVVDERNNTLRRLETRLLVRNADGTLRGATYKWNAAETDAVRVDAPTIEIITVTQANGSTRTPSYLYPGPEQCLRCHNTNAGMILGIKTAQLNGDLHYTQTNRVDNQLHTFSSLGMLNPPLADTATYPQYAKMAAVTDTAATLENRVRSYLASNCGHCHRPGGEGPSYDARYDTPILQQNIVSNGVPGMLIRRDLPNSKIYIRDAVTVIPMAPPPIPGPMPPIARSIPDPNLLATYDAWVNHAYDIAAVTAPSRTLVRVQFNRAVEASSATDPANYAIDNGATVLQATPDADPSVVLLTTSTLTASANYNLIVNRVRESAAPQNPIWPNTVAAFVAPAPPPTVPGAPSIATTQVGNGQVTLAFTAPASSGGAPITNYTASCMPGPLTVSNQGALNITVTGLTNGTTYNCTVTAINAVGPGPASGPVSVTPIAPPVPMLTAVVSQKIHGSAGTFELPIAVLPLTVESRAIGAGHVIVFRFDIPITSPGNVTLTQTSPANGAVASAVANGNDVRVTLTGVTDNQRVTISLANINGIQNAAASASMGFLVGDVNNSRSVNPSDVSSVKARSGQTTTAANFKFDIDTSGSVNASDISAVKARAELALR